MLFWQLRDERTAAESLKLKSLWQTFRLSDFLFHFLTFFCSLFTNIFFLSWLRYLIKDIHPDPITLHEKEVIDGSSFSLYFLQLLSKSCLNKDNW